MRINKPVEIEILDGDTEIGVRCSGGRKGAFRLVTDGCSGRLRLEMFDGEFRGWINLEPDPVRAAELKERQRCRREAARFFEAHPSNVGAALLIAALDAPAETVSEFERGGEAMRERFKSAAGHWTGSTVMGSQVLDWLDAIPGVTEPTP